ncbi:hypothetical protein MKW98_022683 [Papaver atlanticum]|uniref:Pectinesterase inhibitor domain-containing protein n=1 Tax=Papaver atlanticum TaxID=357466 RepID=A0AAD4T1J5_9MAGN|nr:hypothetical protein MKW98_022683 [Papaver atlanticum]
MMKLSTSSLVSLTFSSLLVLFLFSHGVNGADIIEPTCNKAAKSSPNIKYHYCLNSLKANPKSRNADIQQLGIISAELAKSKANSIRIVIKRLLGTNKNRVDNKCLQDCLKIYANAAEDLMEVITDFNAKDYFEANIQMSAAMDASTNCEDGFKQMGLVSPLTKMNDRYFQTTAITLAITNMAR